VQWQEGIQVNYMSLRKDHAKTEGLDLLAGFVREIRKKC
jgi:hypothetical protein